MPLCFCNRGDSENGCGGSTSSECGINCGGGRGCAYDCSVKQTVTVVVVPGMGVSGGGWEGVTVTLNILEIETNESFPACTTVFAASATLTANAAALQSAAVTYLDCGGHYLHCCYCYVISCHCYSISWYCAILDNFTPLLLLFLHQWLQIREVNDQICIMKRCIAELQFTHFPMEMLLVDCNMQEVYRQSCINKNPNT